MFKFLIRNLYKFKISFLFSERIKSHLQINSISDYYSTKPHQNYIESNFGAYKDLLLKFLISINVLSKSNNIKLYFKTRNNREYDKPNEILISILNGKFILFYNNRKIVKKIFLNLDYYNSSLKEEYINYHSFKQLEIKKNSLDLSVVEPLMSLLEQNDISIIISELIKDLYRVNFQNTQQLGASSRFIPEIELYKILYYKGLDEENFFSIVKINQFNIICHGDFTLSNLYKYNNDFIINDCDFVFRGHLSFDLIHFCLNLYESNVKLDAVDKTNVKNFLLYLMRLNQSKSANFILFLYIRDYYISRFVKFKSVKILKYVDMRKLILNQYDKIYKFLDDLELISNTER